MGHFEKRIEGETVWESPEFSLRHDRALLEDGRIARREVIDCPDFVMLLLKTARGEICLGEQYEASVGAGLLMAPCAPVEKGEEPGETAARLLEASGAAGGALRFLGQGYPTPGILSECCHYYSAEIPAEKAPPLLTAVKWACLKKELCGEAAIEGRTLHLLALASACGLLKEGESDHAK